EDILDVVERNRDDIDSAVRALVKAANRGGGEDNITVVAFDITDVAVHDGQTQENVLPSEEEDTLDELDAVPTIDDPAEDKPARRRHLRRRVLAWIVLVVFLAAIAALVAWRLLR